MRRGDGRGARGASEGSDEGGWMRREGRGCAGEHTSHITERKDCVASEAGLPALLLLSLRSSLAGSHLSTLGPCETFRDKC